MWSSSPGVTRDSACGGRRPRYNMYTNDWSWLTKEPSDAGTRRRDRGQPLARRLRPGVPPPASPHAGRQHCGAARPRSGGRRQAGGRGGEPADVHRLPGDAPGGEAGFRASPWPAQGSWRRLRTISSTTAIPFIMEKPMGVNADEVRGIAEKAAVKKGYAAVPMPHALLPVLRAGAEDARCRQLRTVVPRLYADEPVQRRPATSSGTRAGCSTRRSPAGGCLRNLGTHGFDMFYLLTGEDGRGDGCADEPARARATGRGLRVGADPVPGAASSARWRSARPTRASRSRVRRQGPGRDKLLDGADGEWKVCGPRRAADGEGRRDARRHRKRRGDDPRDPEGSPSYRLLKDALDRWQRGEPPPASVHDCYRAVRLIDRAYELAAG